MEALSYLPGAVQEAKRRGGKKLKNYKPVRYACRYLATLQEKDDFNRMERIISKVDLPEEVEKNYNFIRHNYELIGKIINNLREKEKEDLDNLIKEYNLEKEKAKQLLKLAEEINIVWWENDEIYCCSDLPGLREVMKKGSSSDDNGIFKKIKNFFG